MTNGLSDNLEPKKVEIPTLDEAKRDRQEFDGLLVGTVQRSRAEELAKKTELWVEYLFQDAGKIPAGDPRHDIRRVQSYTGGMAKTVGTAETL